jgi:ketosteroid isomerase-like protein
MNLKRSLHLFLLVLLVLSSIPADAQSVAQPDPLFMTIQSLDTKLFDAYNHCDLATLGAMVSDDLEFYHDQTGLSVGKAPFLAAIKQNICGKVQRTLLQDTLEVYPLKGYGAVEVGIHRFHHPGRPEDGVGDAKFVTLWQNKDGAWKVTRVISYNHNQGLLAK